MLDNISNLKLVRKKNSNILGLKIIQVFNDHLIKEKDINNNKLMYDLLFLRQKIEDLNLNDPIIDNIIECVFYNLNSNNFIVRIKKNIKIAELYLKKVDHELVSIGVNKLKKGMSVYVYCFDDVMFNILKKTKNLNLDIYIPEFRPNDNSKKFVNKLIKLGLKVNYFLDIETGNIIKRCDIAFLDSKVVSTDGKILSHNGSRMITELCYKDNVLSYVIAKGFSLDINDKYENDDIHRKKDIIEDNLNVNLFSKKFEEVDSKYITGIISEIGIYPYTKYLEELKRHYPWMS